MNEKDHSKTVMCERCIGDFATWYMEELDEMWCADCRDALKVGIIKMPEKSSIENQCLDQEATKSKKLAYYQTNF